ncbi:glutamine-hydrolyzing carbamoyl-phosphate synthase small subunit [bacterium]|nr:glutamine-hydrolyzing carbamoyl-phosphate synthase small subunit [bacterium]
MKKERAILALADGTVFEGSAIGGSASAKTNSDRSTWGEVVFNTSITGYQEILTDPSYYRQMLTFTYPHIGNVGVNPEDIESKRVQVAGLIVREFSEHLSNFRAKQSLQDYLQTNNVLGISGIDTRALVLHLRTHGSQMGVIAHGEQNVSDVIDRAKACPAMEGMNLIDEVTTNEIYEWRQGVWELGSGYPSISATEASQRPHVVAVDCGIKFNILRLLVTHGFRVTVVPAHADTAQIKALNPDAIFLSNGPGDPATLGNIVKLTQDFLGKKPIFGICLGHQILGQALGVKTFKLKFGHRGGNHPVRDEVTKKVEITVQNHGFATTEEGLRKDARVSHINLNDGTVEGFDVPDAKAFSIQYHPESSPGPHDAQYLFKRFYQMVTN